MQEVIRIHEGNYNRKTISGLYHLVKPYRDYSESELKPGGYAREGYTGWASVAEEGGKPFSVHLRTDSFELQSLQSASVVGSVDVDIEALDRDIRQRFEVLDMFAEAVAANQIRGLIVSGAAGIGKTFKFETRLKQAEESGEIPMLTHLKGKSTPLYLYQTLFLNSEPGCVLLLDDIDAIFTDPDALNLLKSALDSSEERWITYGSASKYLEENGLPQRFKFEGTIVFITNLDFYGMMKRGTALSPHFSALMSRSHYLTLNVYTNTEIMVRVQQVVLETPLCDSLGIDQPTKMEMLEYLWENIDNLREISIRTVLKLVDYVKMGDWRVMANVMLLK